MFKDRLSIKLTNPIYSTSAVLKGVLGAILTLAVLALAVSAAAPNVQAQSGTGTPETGQPETGQQVSGEPVPGEPATQIQRAILKVEARETTALPLSQVTEMTFDLKGIDLGETSLGETGETGLDETGATKGTSLKTNGMTVHGYTRALEAGGQRIGQVMITKLERDGQSVEINYRDFSGQFPLEEAELRSDQPVEVQGDRDQIVRAVQELNAKVEAARVNSSSGLAAKEEDEDEDEPRYVAESNQTSSGLSGSSGSSGSSGTSDDGSGISFDPIEIATETSYDVTSEGCSIVFDRAAGFAIQQTRLRATRDGQTTEEEGCTDSNMKYPLVKDYLGCGITTDLETMKVSAQFRWIYADGSGETQTVSDCAVDEERIFEIVERDTCVIRLDRSAGVATPQSELIYRDEANAEHLVRDCSDSIRLSAVAYTETPEGCPIVDDFKSGVSHQYTTWLYELEGELYAGAPCAETEARGYDYRHLMVFTNTNGGDICRADIIGDSYLRYYRIGIDTEDGRDYRTDCLPDEAGNLAVAETSEGCDDPSLWRHDIGGGQSYGQSRRYVVVDGERRYLTDCADSREVYRHDFAITSWEDHPDLKAMYPLYTVAIDTPAGRYEIVRDHLMTGAVMIPYTYQTSRQDLVRRETSGCNVRGLLQNIAEYTRPDGQAWEMKEGEAFADPAGWKDSCIETRLDRREIHYSSCCGQRVDYNGIYSTALVTFREIDKTERRNTVSKKVVKVFCSLTGKETKRTISYGAYSGPNKGTLSQVLGHSRYRGNPASSCPF